MCFKNTPLALSFPCSAREGSEGGGTRPRTSPLPPSWEKNVNPLLTRLQKRQLPGTAPKWKVLGVQRPRNTQGLHENGKFEECKGSETPRNGICLLFPARTRQHLALDAPSHPSAAPSTAVGRSCPGIPTGLHLPYFFISLETALLSQLQRQLRSQEPPKSRDLFPGSCSRRWQGASAKQSAGKGERGARGTPQKSPGVGHTGTRSPADHPHAGNFRIWGSPWRPRYARRCRTPLAMPAARRKHELQNGRRNATAGVAPKLPAYSCDF